MPSIRKGRAALALVMAAVLLTADSLLAQDTAATAVQVTGASRIMTQDTAVVFVHGVTSDGSTWNVHAAALSQALQITPVTPTVDWTRSENEQANQLAGILNANRLTSNPARRMPFVAHSNGGLVSREYRRIGGRLRQIATVGTPHQGSRLANNWLNNTIWRDGQNVFAALWRPYDFTFALDPAPPQLLEYSWIGVVRPIASFLSAVDALACPAVGFCVVGPGTDVAVPMVGDVAVNSSALAALNSSTNLSAEAATASRRVGLWSAVHPRDIMWYILTSDPGAWASARSESYAWYITWWQYYRDHYDPFLAGYGAPMWLEGAAALGTVDILWQSWIGALNWYSFTISPDGTPSTYMDIVANDGLILHTSGTYPGGTRSDQIRGFVPHTWQMRSSAVTNNLRTTLESDFGIPARTQTPSPSPSPTPSYSVSITGPSEMKSSQTCNWMGSSNIVGATYVWRVGKFTTYTGQEFRYSASATFTLSLTASNSQGHSASTSLTVTVSNDGPTCAFQ